MNIAAVDARNFGLGGSIVESPAGTYTVTLTPTSSIAGNTTSDWGIPSAVVQLNLQNIVAPGSALNNTVQTCTIQTANSFTFDTTAAATLTPLSNDAMAFLVNARSTLSGDGLFLRAGASGVNQDVTFTYDNTNTAFNNNVNLRFTASNPTITNTT